jgi:signal transduction histidine kinase
MCRGLREETAASGSTATGSYDLIELIMKDVLDVATVVAVDFIAESAVRTQSDLVALTAHDIKGPLASIQLVCEMVRRRLRRLKVDDSRLGSNLEGIEREIQRVVLNLDEMTEAARISQVVELDIVSVDLQQLVDRTMVILADEAASRVKIHWARKSQAPIRWDAVRIRHVLHNLILNALRYAPSGDIVVLIKDGSHEQVVISVMDKGIGLSSEEEEHVFDKHYRAPEAILRHSGGSGLGLFLAKSMIEAHNGSIALTSAGKGQGATATITLPNTALKTPVGASQGIASV